MILYFKRWYHFRVPIDRTFLCCHSMADPYLPHYNVITDGVYHHLVEMTLFDKVKYWLYLETERSLGEIRYWPHLSKRATSTKERPMIGGMNINQKMIQLRRMPFLDEPNGFKRRHGVQCLKKSSRMRIKYGFY